MKFDLSRLGDWAALPFFTTDLPDIEARLSDETVPVLPPGDLVFAALERCPPDRTRVVILGQDPYHTPGKADGLAFSIPDAFGGRLDSLGNIFRELQDDLGAARTRTDLRDWADQGVLLLNTSLTVPAGQPWRTQAVWAGRDLSSRCWRASPTGRAPTSSGAAPRRRPRASWTAR